MVHRYALRKNYLRLPEDAANRDSTLVAYALGIYLLNLFLAFLQPKFDPSNDDAENDMEDGVGVLPTKSDEEFRPFIRRLPEFKFWYWATRAVTISFCCTWFEIFNIPVFWPILVMYWMILFVLTSEHPLYVHRNMAAANSFHSAQANPAHDQVPIRSFHCRQAHLRQGELLNALEPSRIADAATTAPGFWRTTLEANSV